MTFTFNVMDSRTNELVETLLVSVDTTGQTVMTNNSIITVRHYKGEVEV